ncbi:hypothetical protein HF520_02830 [Romboutsia sp. CE17]|uniref:endonuclease/exonuclease/phosphatase family protein n=1 Tax=Romboutsia sp. CE17 TaxID=2724150 RepID=UPI001442D002|nr:endonuclease/exonuclease/phosphatase family protein [Romboutsia sp. CE17]QJA07939.1 hypothetical protein HF520_02830 [Romboutsia sp. CE17]
MNIKKIIITFIILSFIIISSISEKSFFPESREIKIISYNIHSGLDKNMYPTLFDIIDFLKMSDADIICLQEVNESAKVGFQVSSLKEELKMYSHFGANVVNFGSNYGLVTYSKYPIKSEKHIYLSSEREQRGLLHTVIDVNGKKLNVINVHLGVKKEEREIQIKEVLDYAKSLGSEPYIVLGDFNEGSISLEGTNLKDAAEETGNSNILTFALGLYRIDYILVSSNIEVIDYNVQIKNMSDHYPILAKLKI